MSTKLSSQYAYRKLIRDPMTPILPEFVFRTTLPSPTEAMLLWHWYLTIRGALHWAYQSLATSYLEILTAPAAPQRHWLVARLT